MNGTETDELLRAALDAHGGLARWHAMHHLTALVVSGGLLYDLKGQPQDRTPRQVTVTLATMRTSLQPFGASDRRMTFTPERTSIERIDGTILDAATDLPASFVGHRIDTAWTPLQRAYFSGYALWTYLNSPFLLTMPGVELHPTDPVEHDGDALDGIGAVFPPGFPTHSRRQQFFFGADHLLRRHDYHVDIAGAFPASQYLDDYVCTAGFAMPTTRRAYHNGGATNREELMVSMQLSDFRFTPVDRKYTDQYGRDT